MAGGAAAAQQKPMAAAAANQDPWGDSTLVLSKEKVDGRWRDKWRTLGEVAGGSTPMLRARDGGAQLYELVGFPYYGRNLDTRQYVCCM